MPNPTPFKDLAGYMDKQVIACVEGRIVSVSPKLAEGSHPQYGPWSMQFSELRDADGTKHQLTLTDSSMFLSADAVGKLIHLESTPQAKGGPAGVTLSERTDKRGTLQRSIKVDNRAALNFPEGAPALGTASQRSASPQNAPTQGRAVSVQSGGPQANLDQSPVRERVHCYFEVLKEVSAKYKHLQSTLEEGTLPKLTASDIKDITTSISLSYRGEFGSYAKPIFQQEKKPSPQVEEPQDQGGGELSDDDIPFAPAWKSLGSGVF